MPRIRPRLPDPPPGTNLGLPTDADMDEILEGNRSGFLYPALLMVLVLFGVTTLLFVTGVIK